MKIYLDFDGTIVEHHYPIIGEQNPDSFKVVDMLIKADHKIILNTMRVEFQDGTLEEAMNYIQKELSKIDAAYKNFKLEHTHEKIHPPLWNWDRHLEDQCIYIDDICIGTPMRNNITRLGEMVDWSTLNKQFREFGVY
jgi:hypothetical protein